MTKARELELLERAHGGDDEALGELCQWIRPALIRLFIWKWQVESHAEDLTQETLLNIVEGFRRRHSITNFKAYAFKRAKWAALDFLQAVKLQFGLSRNHVHSQYGHERPLEIVPIHESHKVDAGIEDRAIAQAVVRDALENKLTLAARAAVEAFYFEGKEQSEIAHDINQSKATVSRLLRAGREQMRCALSGEEYRLTKSGCVPRPLQGAQHGAA